MIMDDDENIDDDDDGIQRVISRGQFYLRCDRFSLRFVVIDSHCDWL